MDTQDLFYSAYDTHNELAFALYNDEIPSGRIQSALCQLAITTAEQWEALQKEYSAYHARLKHHEAEPYSYKQERDVICCLDSVSHTRSEIEVLRSFLDALKPLVDFHETNTPRQTLEGLYLALMRWRPLIAKYDPSAFANLNEIYGMVMRNFD